jgi:hypothetical protein
MAGNQPQARFATLLPGVGLTVLSKFTCSACLGAYSGLLASLGVGAVATDSGLTILTAALLALGLASVVWSTRRHRHMGPLSVVLVGSAVLFGSRILAPSTEILLVGAALTLAGSGWNLWLERRPPDCCATPRTDVAQEETT